MKEKLINNIEDFKTVDDFQKHVRTNGTDDYVKIDKVVFTMDNYDMSGKEISYANIHDEKRLMVYTKNRYGENGFKDAICEIIDLGCYRTDINYLH